MVDCARGPRPIDLPICLSIYTSVRVEINAVRFKYSECMFSIERRSIEKHVHLYFGNQDLKRIEEISLSGIKDKRLLYII